MLRKKECILQKKFIQKLKQTNLDLRNIKKILEI